MQQLIDRPSISIPNFDRMVTELSPHMSEWEIDRIVEFMQTISASKLEVNWTVEDSAAQLRIILGSERYEQVKAQWSLKNQHLIQQGQTKWIHLASGRVYDGLDAEDDPSDYTRIAM